MVEGFEVGCWHRRGRCIAYGSRSAISLSGVYYVAYEVSEVVFSVAVLVVCGGGHDEILRRVSSRESR